MNLNRALHHLAGAGITPAVLEASGINHRDPAAVRAEVVVLLAAATTGEVLADMRQIALLQKALAALRTPQDWAGTPPARRAPAGLAPGRCR